MARSMDSGFANERRLVPDSIYGVRRWTVLPNGKLTSYAAGYTWHPGWNFATCHGQPHHLRSDYGRYCGCGFWAYWDEHGGHVKVTGGGNAVIGIVEGRGAALVGGSGFRIEQARIVALVTTPTGKQRWIKAGILAGILCYFAVMALIAYTTDQANWSVVYGLMGGIMFGAGAVVLRRTPLGVLHNLARQYPEAKQYPSIKAAYKDFPVEVPSWKKKK